jgi:N-carbamoylputrescine amidase
MSKIKVGLVQMSCSATAEENVAKAVREIEVAASKGANIVCLQELFCSLYFCDVEDHNNFKLAEPIPGKTTDLLQSVAKKNNVVIIASLFEKRSSGLYHNTTAVLDADGTYLGKYRKMHIPDDPGYYEKFYFTPGDAPVGHVGAEDGYKNFDTKFGRIGC